MKNELHLLKSKTIEASHRRFIRINGKRHTKRFHRKSDADRWYLEMRREKELIEGGLKSDVVPLALEQFATKWLEQRRGEGRPESSCKSDEQRLKLHIFPKLGERQLQKISRREWEEFLINLVVKKGLAPATRNRIQSLCCKMYNDAKRQEVVMSNPLDTIPKVRESNDKWDYWHTLEECQRYVEAASVESPIFLLFALIALNTGARVGEILGLQWQDVNLEQRRLHIRRIFEAETQTICERTKGKRSRWLGINDSLFDALVEYRRTTKFLSPTDLLIHQIDGSPSNQWRIRRRHERNCARAGVKKIRVHDLRHTYASHFVMNGGNLVDLQAILGHSTFEMTQKYAHLAPGHLESKANIVKISSMNEKCGVVIPLRG